MTYSRSFATLSDSNREKIFGHAFRQDQILVQEKLQSNEVNDIYIPDYSVNNDLIFQAMFPVGSVLTLKTPLSDIDGAILVSNDSPDNIKYLYKGCTFKFISIESPGSFDLQYDTLIGAGFTDNNGSGFYENTQGNGEHQLSFTINSQTAGHTLTVDEIPSHSHAMPTFNAQGNESVHIPNYTVFNNSETRYAVETTSVGDNQPHTHNFTAGAVMMNNPRHINLFFYERIQ